MKTDVLKRYCDVAIIGKGTAGLSVAARLSEKLKNDISVTVVGSNFGNSAFSPWNLRLQDTNSMFELLSRGIKDNDQISLVRKVSEEHQNAVNWLLSGSNIQVVETPFGIRPVGYATGRRMLKLLESKINNYFSTINGKVTDINIEPNNFKTFTSSKKSNTEIQSKYLVIASGGKGHIQENTTGNVSKNTNIINLVERKGVETVDTDRAMIHPFLIKDEKTGISGLIAGKFLTTCDFYSIDKFGNTNEFLPSNIKDSIKNNDYHHLFSDLEKLFSSEVVKGNKIIMCTRMTEKDFESFKLNDEYGQIFKNKNFDEINRGLNIVPGYHYTLGGIRIDKQCETNIPGLFALGESSNLYNERPGGVGHIDSLVLSDVIASAIN